MTSDSLAQRFEHENETREGVGSSPGQTYLFLFVASLTIHLLKPLSHYGVSTRVSTAFQDTKGKGTSRVRRTYVSILS